MLKDFTWRGPRALSMTVVVAMAVVVVAAVISPADMDHGRRRIMVMADHNGRVAGVGAVGVCISAVAPTHAGECRKAQQGCSASNQPRPLSASDRHF